MKVLDKVKIMKKVVQAFKAWLKEEDYETVTEAYPGAVAVDVLVNDYLEEFPDHLPAKPSLESAAAKMGFVSQLDWDDNDVMEDKGEEDLRGYGF